jgi:mono/diheme cytochrome c family protein
MRYLARGAVVLAAIVAAAAHAATPLPSLYTLHCSGCHGEDGKGAPARGIPNLKDAGRYLAIPIGRQYLIEVPGVSQSVLSDELAAQLLNYILDRFSRDQLPTPFIPYSAEEVAKYRADKASDAPSRREAVIKQLRELNAWSESY